MANPWKETAACLGEESKTCGLRDAKGHLERASAGRRCFYRSARAAYRRSTRSECKAMQTTKSDEGRFADKLSSYSRPRRESPRAAEFAWYDTWAGTQVSGSGIDMSGPQLTSRHFLACAIEAYCLTDLCGKW